MPLFTIRRRDEVGRESAPASVVAGGELSDHKKVLIFGYGGLEGSFLRFGQTAGGERRRGNLRDACREPGSASHAGVARGAVQGAHDSIHSAGRYLLSRATLGQFAAWLRATLMSELCLLKMVQSLRPSRKLWLVYAVVKYAGIACRNVTADGTVTKTLRENGRRRCSSRRGSGDPRRISGVFRFRISSSAGSHAPSTEPDVVAPATAFFLLAPASDQWLKQTTVNHSTVEMSQIGTSLKSVFLIVFVSTKKAQLLRGLNS